MKHFAGHIIPCSRPKLTNRVSFGDAYDRREFAGFFGSCSSFRLNSIGLSLNPILSGLHLNQSLNKREYSEMFKVGPIGSTHSYDESWDEKGQTMISNIYVTFDDYGIKSIQFIYFQEGAHVESQKHGYSGGQHIKRVRLENDEYLTALSGVHNTWISSLTFHTNKRQYGPFGDRKYDIYDNYNKREIDVGIRGRSEFGGLFGSFSVHCGYLMSIGMYVSHNTSSIDAVPRMLGATYYNQFIRYQSLDPTTTRVYYKNPKIVDGFPVKTSRRYKPKLKDTILSKLEKAIRFLINR